MLWIPSLLVSIVLVGDTPTVVQKAAEASPKPVVVVTDSSWKGSPTGPDGWRTERFDDSGWPAVRTGDGPGEHYSPANMFGCSTQAEYIWGGTERICYLRKSFQAPARYRRAEMVVAADNVAEVFLNGLRVTSKDE